MNQSSPPEPSPRLPADLSSTETPIESQFERRRRELLEAFVEHCRRNLREPLGMEATDFLFRNFDIPPHRAGRLPLGVYSTCDEVRHYLSGQGFDEAEIHAAAVAGDERLGSRLIVPWRGPEGLLQTVIAMDLAQDGHKLFLRGGTREEFFGLDTALRHVEDGCRHLMLVERILDVVYLHARGVTNVAAVGREGTVPTAEHWFELQARGVRSVTLAFADTNSGRERTYQSAWEAARLDGEAPILYTFSGDDFEGEGTLAAFVRSQGVERLRELIPRRIHLDRFVALEILRRYRPDGQWTDAGLVDALEEAILYDSLIVDPHRAMQLRAFFWPVVLDAAEVDESDVAWLLRERLAVPESRLHGCWTPMNLKTLLRDLHLSLREEDYERFERLILQAADDILSGAVQAEEEWLEEEAEEEAEPAAELKQEEELEEVEAEVEEEAPEEPEAEQEPVEPEPEPVEPELAPEQLPEFLFASVGPIVVEADFVEHSLGEGAGVQACEVTPQVGTVVRLDSIPEPTDWTEEEPAEPPSDELNPWESPDLWIETLEEPSEEAIRQLAYRLWDVAGRPEGCDQDFWLLAREKLRGTRPDVIPFCNLTPRQVAALNRMPSRFG